MKKNKTKKRIPLTKIQLEILFLEDALNKRLYSYEYSIEVKERIDWLKGKL